MNSGDGPGASHRREFRVLLVAPLPPPYGGMALQGLALERRLRSDGHCVVLFAANAPLPRRLRFLERVPGLRTLARVIAIWIKLWSAVCEVDIVHIFAASWFYFFSVVAASATVARLLGKRVILNYRGGEAGKFLRRFRMLAKPVFRLSHVVTAPSQFLADVLRQTLDISVSIVPNIVDTSAFRYEPRASLSPRLLANRHLERIYDPESILGAFRRVQAHRPDASLWFVGGGNLEAPLRALVAEWNLRDVRFLGPVPHHQMPDIYRQRDVLVNASVVDNFPAGLVEASAAGLPVVSTAAGGIPAIYTDGETAVLTPPGDSNALANAILAVLDSPIRALEMAERASTMVRAYEWARVRPLLYHVYGGEGDPAAPPTEADAVPESNVSTRRNT